MNNVKKNNKGFSLVELIVVVLIMAIIAVSLAPQVMKWVDNSKKNSDINNAGVIASAVQAALAEWQGAGGSLDAFTNTWVGDSIVSKKLKSGTFDADKYKVTVGSDTKTLQDLISSPA